MNLKVALIMALTMTLTMMLRAEEMRLCTKHDMQCYCHGNQYYEGCLSYELNFETGDLDLSQGRGEGKLMKIMIVVPKKGNKSSALPLGVFNIGPCDSMKVGTVDYYASHAEYYGKVNDIYSQPDESEAFVQCNVNITKQKAGKYQITMAYELTNGERGEYSYNGKVKLHKDLLNPEFMYMPRKPYTKNWELTKAEITVYDSTAYGSRRAVLQFDCEDALSGYVLIYLPMDSVYGRYDVRYGKEAGSCEASKGDVIMQGEMVFIYGGIEDFSEGTNYYPVSGYVLIKHEKVFMEFATKDGSTVRCVYKGELKNARNSSDSNTVQRQ